MTYYIDVTDKDGGSVPTYSDESFETARDAQDFLDRLDGGDAALHGTVFLSGVVIDDEGNEVSVPRKAKKPSGDWKWGNVKVVKQKQNVKMYKWSRVFPTGYIPNKNGSISLPQKDLPYAIDVMAGSGGPAHGYEEHRFETVDKARTYLDALTGNLGGYVVHAITRKSVDEKLHKAMEVLRGLGEKKDQLRYKIYVTDKDGNHLTGYDSQSFQSIGKANNYIGNLGPTRSGYVADKDGNLVNGMHFIGKRLPTKKKKKTADYRIRVVDAFGDHASIYDYHKFTTTEKAYDFLGTLDNGYVGQVTNKDGVAMLPRRRGAGLKSRTSKKIPCQIEVGEAEKVYGYLKFDSIPEARSYLDGLNGKHNQEEFTIGKNILDARGQIIE